MRRRTQILLALSSLISRVRPACMSSPRSTRWSQRHNHHTANTIPAGALIDATMLTERDVPPDVARDTLCVALMLIQLRRLCRCDVVARA